MTAPIRPRTLTLLGASAILVATLIGPTIVIVPDAVASAGVLPSLAILIILWLLGSLCASMLCEALAAVPNNGHYASQVEFVSAVHYYLGPKQYHICVAAFNFGFLLTIVLSIVQSANVCDGLIAEVMGHSCGIRLNFPPSIVCHRAPLMPDEDFCKKFERNEQRCLSDSALGCNWGHPQDFGITPEHRFFEKQDPSAADYVAFEVQYGCFPDSRTLWGRGVPIVITHGLILVAVVCLPLSLGNLESNVGVQVVSVIGTTIIFLVWGVAMWKRGEVNPPGYQIIPNEMKMIGGGMGVANLVGTVLYSSGFAHLMPSVLNESRKSINVNLLIWGSSTFALVTTIFLGFGGASVFGHLFLGNIRADLLEAITDSRQTPEPYLSWAQFGVWLFPFLVLVPGIPVACVMLKYNLRQEGPMFSEPAAVFWGIFFPFLVSLPFLSYHSLLNTAVAWLSVGVLSLIDIFIPLRLYLSYIQWKIHTAADRAALLGLPEQKRDRVRRGSSSALLQSAEVTPPQRSTVPSLHDSAPTPPPRPRDVNAEGRVTPPPKYVSYGTIDRAERRRPSFSTPSRSSVRDSFGTADPQSPRQQLLFDQHANEGRGSYRTVGGDRSSDTRSSGTPTPVPLFIEENDAEGEYIGGDMSAEVQRIMDNADSVFVESPSHYCPDTTATHVAFPAWLGKVVTLERIPALCKAVMAVFAVLMIATVSSMVLPLLDGGTSPSPSGRESSASGSSSDGGDAPKDSSSRLRRHANFDYRSHRRHNEK